ncbi:hypothetical protein B0H17DRAFT_1068248 [Mycena rosella]|uniref:DUF6593 domain-containing protein n=1 Tax=Mycena rosella TaxID=1033263 RepID=A0AAD7DCV7_MYCRO|nr:hypothetical protein B0H17DRAFT_1068248 [Mycena rosella]
MRLLVTTNKPINANYRDAESGVTQYKARTPIKVPELKTTISRLLDSDIPRREQADPDDDIHNDRFGMLAQVSWRMGGPSVIQFGGQEIDPATFFRRENQGWHGKPREYIFTAQDGKEYRWILRPYTTRLKTNDESATLVAEYRANSLGILSRARPASLTIFPPFEDMADEIMVTFIYIEKQRRSHIDGNTQL